MFVQQDIPKTTETEWTVEADELLGIGEERHWASLAACREADPVTFFPGPDGDASEALKYCNACAVVDQCLDYALSARERYGVWGGTTEKQRKSMLRRVS